LIFKKNNWIYLDNAASTPPLKNTAKKIAKALKEYGSIHRGNSFMSEISTNRYEKARKGILKALKGSKDFSLIFTTNTTEAINRFTLMIPLKKILTVDIEHSSNYLPWVKRAEKVIFIPTDKTFKINPKVLKNILKKEDIQILTFATASNISGRAYTNKELKEIYKIAKKYNVFVFHDAAQHIGHFNTNLKYCDAMAFAGHKMYAPFGGGCLIARKDFFKNNYNSFTGGGNVEYINFKTGKVTYKKIPHNHEVGTPNFIGAYSIYLALKELRKKKHAKHSKKLAKTMKKELSQWDLLKGKKESPIVLLDKKYAPILEKHKIAFRIGHFCVYNFIDKYLKGREVIRLSGGMTTKKEDILKIKEILSYNKTTLKN